MLANGKEDDQGEQWLLIKKRDPVAVKGWDAEDHPASVKTGRTNDDVKAARDVAGPGVPIMLDTNCPWSLGEAIEMARRLRPFDLYWLEEPCWPPENYAALAKVRSVSGIPIAARTSMS